MATNLVLSKRRNKQIDKNDRIVEAAYQLFLEQGFEQVSIQEIVARAGVAKGTFYLYFHDTDQLREYVISQKSSEIFRHALHALRQTDISDFENQIIFVIDYVIDVLSQNRDAMKLIAKDLSFGLFNRKVSEYFASGQVDILHALLSAAAKNHVRLKNPKILLYMIIELVSSTCFSCILDSEPLEVAVFKPYLFDAVRALIHSQTIDSTGFQK